MLRFRNNCHTLFLSKKYDIEIKKLMEANVNLKKINEVLINSINLKDNLYINLLLKNKNLKAEFNLLKFQITSINKFYSTN